MKVLKTLCLLILFTSLTLACKKNEKNGSDSSASKVDAMAKEVCDCKKGLAELNDKMEVLTKENKTNEVMALFEKIGALSKDVAKCETAIKKKYPNQTMASAETKLKTLCPSVAKMIDKQKALDQE